MTTTAELHHLGPVDTPRDPGDGAAPRRSRRLASTETVLLSLAGLTFVLVTWELAVRTGLLSPSTVPAMSDTITRVFMLATSGTLTPYLLATLHAWLVGFAIAVSIALPVGVTLGLSDRAYRFVRVPIEAIRPVPPIVILPLALLAIGGGVAFQATLIVQGALWPLLISVIYAIRDTEPVALDTARSFRLGAWRTLLFVRLPSGASLIGSGLRLAAATSFAVTLVTEILGGARGLGTILMTAQSGGDVVTVYAVTIAAGVVGLAIAAVFGLLERHLPGWKKAGS